MLRGYNLVPWENITLPIKDVNQLFMGHNTYGWTFQAYLFTPRACPQNETGMNSLIGLIYYL